MWSIAEGLNRLGQSKLRLANILIFSTPPLESTTPRMLVEIGKPNPYTLYTHCGVRNAEFDGRRWIADPILGDNNPPPGWGNPFDKGSMELVAEDRARFTRSAGLVAEFQPLPEGSEYP